MSRTDPSAEVRRHFAAQHVPDQLAHDLIDEAERHKHEEQFSWMLPLVVISFVAVVTIVFIGI
jgi:hypothetical protein